MPTYAFRCVKCANVEEVVRSISDYIAHRPVLMCCGAQMQRHFVGDRGLLVVSERHYENLRALDGTDISSRAKHRAYMKAKGLTTVDDYKDTWKREAQQRAERLQGVDHQRADDVARAYRKHEHG